MKVKYDPEQKTLFHPTQRRGCLKFYAYPLLWRFFLLLVFLCFFPSISQAKAIVDHESELLELADSLIEKRQLLQEIMQLRRLAIQRIHSFEALLANRNTLPIQEEWDYEQTHFTRYAGFLHYRTEDGEGIRFNNGAKIYHTQTKIKVTHEDGWVFLYKTDSEWVEILTKEDTLYWRNESMQGLIKYVGELDAIHSSVQQDMTGFITRLQVNEEEDEHQRSFHWKYHQEFEENFPKKEKITWRNQNFFQWEYQNQTIQLLATINQYFIRISSNPSYSLIYPDDTGYYLTDVGTVKFRNTGANRRLDFSISQNLLSSQNSISPNASFSLLQDVLQDVIKDFPGTYNIHVMQEYLAQEQHYTNKKISMIRWINRYRSQYGMNGIISDPYLERANQAHIGYLQGMISTGHSIESYSVELPQYHGFTGQYAVNRAQTAGYSGYAADLFSSSITPWEALYYWSTDPYIRHKILHPHALHYAWSMSTAIPGILLSLGHPLYFQDSSTIQYWLSPHNGEQRVPTHFKTGNGIKGYPMVLHLSKPVSQTIRLEYGLQNNDAQPISCNLVTTARNDAFYFFPTQPLEPGTWYQLQVKLYMNEQCKINETIVFQTQSYYVLEELFHRIWQKIHE